MTSFSKIFEVGFLHLIRGEITTSHADRDIAGLGGGSFKIARSQNGKNPDRALFYGSTGNVSYRPTLTLLQRLTAFPCRSGLWEECTLVR